MTASSIVTHGNVSLNIVRTEKQAAATTIKHIGEKMVKTFALTLAVSTLALAPTGFADTVFLGGDIALSGNWDNGLPTSAGNPGSIAVNGTVNVDFNNTYFITQTAGTIGSAGFGSDYNLNGGAFTQNGGTWGSAGNRGFKITGGNQTTLESGAIIGGANSNSSITASTMIINGGSFTQYGTGRGVFLSGGAVLTINGGAFSTITESATNTFGINSLASGDNYINLNGGTVSVNFLGFGRNNSGSQLTYVIGGATPGSFTAVDFVALSATELITERKFNWLSGSLMTFTVSNADDWAEIEWSADRLLYNGQSSTALGGLSWADATNPTVGLGDGAYFAFDGGANTLSLGAPIPEPSTFALLGLLGLFTVRRRAK
ncbi:MAG: PEP-CTERM sorting domain-containing protein [Lentisphaeria bacterium]|nr:PEP-CTERM sorting domain-containing protein [Lentisphaeria bacterium]